MMLCPPYVSLEETMTRYAIPDNSESPNDVEYICA